MTNTEKAWSRTLVVSAPPTIKTAPGLIREPGSYWITTFGCQMNKADSERMAGILESMGYSPASAELDADLVLYNTCTIRDNAEQKVYSYLGRQARRKHHNPNLTLIVAGWQYLQQPEAIAAELLRVTRPNGVLICAFSNRMFFSKAPQIWTDGDDRDHLSYVATVLMAQGWPKPEIIAEQTRGQGVMGLLGGKGDPFFAVVANKALG